jgi:hypothetical protein
MEQYLSAKDAKDAGDQSNFGFQFTAGLTGIHRELIPR